MTGVQTCALPIYDPLHDGGVLAQLEEIARHLLRRQVDLLRDEGQVAREDHVARRGEARGVAPDEQVIFSATEGDLVQPLTGRPQAPKPLDAEPISLTAKQDRRVPLADWLTSPKNEHFTKTIVNRVWANFFGVGLVEAVDDIRDRKSTRLNSSHIPLSRMPSSA